MTVPHACPFHHQTSYLVEVRTPTFVVMPNISQLRRTGPGTAKIGRISSRGFSQTRRNQGTGSDSGQNRPLKDSSPLKAPTCLATKTSKPTRQMYLPRPGEIIQNKTIRYPHNIRYYHPPPRLSGSTDPAVGFSSPTRFTALSSHGETADPDTSSRFPPLPVT